MAGTDLTDTRRQLHRVAAHILARRRFHEVGRFGLRASPGGFTTGPFGPGPDTLRIAGDRLVHEDGPNAVTIPITGHSLRDLAAATRTDLGADFSAGAGMPDPGDLDAPIRLDADACDAMADWFDTGWRVLDAVVAAMGPGAAPATIQLWPEHFDAGTNVAVGGDRANLGFSAGDSFSADPYAYIGPWTAARPGDPQFWNAPFGAVLTRSAAGPDPGGSARSFLERGLSLLARP